MPQPLATMKQTRESPTPVETCNDPVAGINLVAERWGGEPALTNDPILSILCIHVSFRLSPGASVESMNVKERLPSSSHHPFLE